MEGYDLFKEEQTLWLDQLDCSMGETHDRFVKGSSKKLFRAVLHYDFELQVSGETLKFFDLKKKYDKVVVGG